MQTGESDPSRPKYVLMIEFKECSLEQAREYIQSKPEIHDPECVLRNAISCVEHMSGLWIVQNDGTLAKPDGTIQEGIMRKMEVYDVWRSVRDMLTLNFFKCCFEDGGHVIPGSAIRPAITSDTHSCTLSIDDNGFYVDQVREEWKAAR